MWSLLDPAPHTTEHTLHNLVQLSLHIITLAEADPVATHNTYTKAKSKANISKMVDLLEMLQGSEIECFAFSLALGIDDLDSQINAGTLGDRHMTPF